MRACLSGVVRFAGAFCATMLSGTVTVRSRGSTSAFVALTAVTPVASG